MKASPQSSIHDFKAFAQKIWPRNTDIAHFLKKYHLGLSCDYLLSAKQTYRVAGLSCPEAGVCLSAILRGFPDSRAANDPLVLSQSLLYSRRFYIPNTMLNRHQPTVCSMYKT